MSITTVRNYFQTKINTYATAESLPVSYQGVGFTKPSSGLWLECFLIPSGTINRELRGKATLFGLFQVNVWMQKGKGTAAIESVADDIVALFPVIPKDSVVSVEETPSVGRIILDDSGWLILPITIKYRLETTV